MRLCRRAQRAARRKSEQIQLLRAWLQKSHAHLSGTQTALAKTFAFLHRAPVQQNFKQKRFCFFRLPLVLAVWRVMHKKLLCLSPLYSLQSGNTKGGPGGNVRARFLDTSCRVARSVNKMPRSTRAKLCAPGYEVVKTLAKPKSPPKEPALWTFPNSLNK